jgi:hypothetical protein
MHIQVIVKKQLVGEKINEKLEKKTKEKHSSSD